jgi:hypothetical protein
LGTLENDLIGTGSIFGRLFVDSRGGKFITVPSGEFGVLVVDNLISDWTVYEFRPSTLTVFDLRGGNTNKSPIEVV